ncbi:hypothetical protein T440DRAFT_473823 [Plenodomus tracheiphilus IPT5]|uniref:Nucleoside 2-deoxyribosyltransferase n=1 Tax=Plenodomus tracheiphilus IPT5 TaxID=1408161 RepID=A0A6A7ALU8_9PLEO|nr:hypothetical protein T440DRAFT_473823 [Plenodomus tracheiphilus IPT5]
MAAQCSKEHDSQAPNSGQSTAVTGEKSACEDCNTLNGATRSETSVKQNSAAAHDVNQEVVDEFNQLPAYPSPPLEPHPQFKHCMPPEPPTYTKYSVFTAGSIEMGKAIQWQKLLAHMLSPLPIVVNNPRRGHWDPEVAKKADDKDFRVQFEWELDAMEQADVICFFFDVGTMSPVTLLELGLWAASGKVVVCCGDQFYRSGNVELVCKRYDIPYCKKFAEMVPAIPIMLEEKGMVLVDGNLVGPNLHIEKPKPRKKESRPGKPDSGYESKSGDNDRQLCELESKNAKMETTLLT